MATETAAEQVEMFGGYLSSRCVRCGRSLSDPVSMVRGMGPICARKAAWEEKQVETGQITLHEPEIRDRVVLKRIDGRVATNVPWMLVSHSPDGFEWGYGGSGPADLALNICEIAVSHVIPTVDHTAVKLYGHDGDFKERCSREAWLLHQDFKWEFLADIPDEGAEIPWEEIAEWVRANAKVWESL